MRKHRKNNLVLSSILVFFVTALGFSGRTAAKNSKRYQFLATGVTIAAILANPGTIPSGKIEAVEIIIATTVAIATTAM